MWHICSMNSHSELLFLMTILYSITNNGSKTIYPVIDRFITHEVRSHFHICDQSIVKIFIRGILLGFSNTYHVDSLDRFKNQLLIIPKYKYVLKESIQNNIIQKYNIQMKPFKNLESVIQ